MSCRPGFAMDDAVLPLGLVSGLVELAQQQQLDCHRLLRGSRLFYEDLFDQQRLVTPAQWLYLVERLSKLLPDSDAMAMLYGQQQALNHHPLLLALWRNSANLAQGLTLLGRCSPLLQPLLQLRLRPLGEQLVIQLQPTMMLGTAQRFISLAMIAALQSLLKEQLGPEVRLRFVLPWRGDAWDPHYATVLGEQLRFAAPFCGVSVPSQVLYRPFAEASQLRRLQALRQARQQLARLHWRESLQSQLRRLCRRQLQQGVSLEQAASYVGLSPATLKRRLQADGVCFQQLQDDVRREEVLLRLDLYGYSNRQLAACLNISDPHNFRRIFKRWTGVVPSSFRSG